MTSENSQIASNALQICLILGFMVCTTSGWHCGFGSDTERASTVDGSRQSEEMATTTSSSEEEEEARVVKDVDKGSSEISRNTRFIEPCVTSAIYWVKFKSYRCIPNQSS